MYHETDSFHLGSDGVIHFTETHLKNRFDDFCVDITVDDQVLERENEYDDVESGGDEGYPYEQDSYEAQYDGNYADEYYSYSADDHDTETGTGNSSNCMPTHDYENYDPGNKPHPMAAFFCDFPFIEVRKCCDKNYNLNLRYILVSE